MYKIVSVCLYTLHAWPQARKKLLVPPELISLNLQGGTNLPRNPRKVRECRRLPGAVYCNKWICTAHPGTQLPTDTAAAKGEETISKSSNTLSCSTCLYFERQKVHERSRSCCSSIEGVLSVSRGEVSNLHHQKGTS